MIPGALWRRTAKRESETRRRWAGAAARRSRGVGVPRSPWKTKAGCF